MPDMSFACLTPVSASGGAVPQVTPAEPLRCKKLSCITEDVSGTARPGGKLWQHTVCHRILPAHLIQISDEAMLWQQEEM